MSSSIDYARFANLSFDDFRRMAQDESLSRYEKIGFPDTYRAGREAFIFEDMLAKLPGLASQTGKVVLDIGPGCSELPSLIAEHCRRQGHRLVLVDSAEMLAQLPDAPHVEKIAGYFPRCYPQLDPRRGAVDVIVVYSVLHYVFTESNLWEFLDRVLELLADGGELLLGDIPNVSKRKRFFASASGVRSHQAFTGSSEHPEVVFNRLEPAHIDDSVIFALLQRARLAGFDAFVVPQGPKLPMHNRREDILIRKP